MSQLIYDIGMHQGEDSEFYLLKGFRVVAVEADAELCRAAAERLRKFLAIGQLTIVNRAIATERGPVTFYRSEQSGWGTIVRNWAEDAAALGVPSTTTRVEAITLTDLTAEYGDAFYMKLDIEGMDRAAVETLATTAVRPRFISMETSFARNPSFDAVNADFEILTELGYDRFKIVDQTMVPDQKPPNPPAAGRYVPYRFDRGESGLFGEETPGDWLMKEQALAVFRRIFRKKWLQVRLYRKRRLYLYYCAIMYHLTGRHPILGWYDIHAKHSTVE